MWLDCVWDTNLGSIVGGLRDHLERKGIFTLTSYNLCISTLSQKLERKGRDSVGDLQFAY